MACNQYNSQKNIMRQNIKSRYFHVVLEQTNKQTITIMNCKILNVGML